MVYNNLGLVQRALGKLSAALTCFRRALEIDPHSKESWLNLGITLKDLGRPIEALNAIKCSISMGPALAEAHYNMGVLLVQLGRHKEATGAYSKAIQIRPAFPEAFNNFGIALQELGRTQEAIRCFQRAVSLDSRNAKAYYNLSILYQFHGQHSQAVACARSALAVAPDFSDAQNILLRHLRELCDWSGMASMLNDGGKTDFSEKALLKMFPEFASDYAQAVLERAKRKSGALALRAANTTKRCCHGPGPWRSRGQRITIGYLSGNFRDHPTSHLICDMFGWHDHKRFQIDCYSYGKNDGSAFRKMIEKESDRFVDLYNVDSASAAARIHANRVAILVDLNGYTACSRTDICSYRPAPIQVRYLGEAKTSGAAFFDYLIGDEIVTPETDAAHYAEKLVLMPHSYQVNSRPALRKLDRECGRRQFNLPTGRFVFCSFATSYKIDPVLFGCWLQILEQVPQSILWLVKRDDGVESALKKVASAKGIEPNRLVFAAPLPKPEHLSRLGLADLCLDTRAVNGAATTSDALWAGIPVVTVKGRHFASRMSESILKAIDFPEMVAENLEQYVTLAVSLARSPMRLKKIREKLEIESKRSPLFDTRRFVGNLENAFEQMWQLFSEGKKPAQIHVQDCGWVPE